MKLQPQSFQREIRQVISGQYLLSLPQGYGEDAAKRWPMILFLHGAGERGDDLELVKVHGPPKLVQEGHNLPFILVSPQCPAGQVWNVDVLGALLDEVIERHAVDTERIYLTGLSMGGYGTFALGLAQADRFAAIAPICGGGLPLTVRPEHAKVNAWVFHGAKDSVVPLSESEKMVAAFRRAEASVRFTVYPEADHDSWTETYANPELYEWFLQHRRAPSA